MSRYANGKIYKLVNDFNGDIYIGCTTRDLPTVLKEHLQKAKESIPIYRYRTVPVKHSYFHNRMCIDSDTTTWSTELIIDIDCETREELKQAAERSRLLHYSQYKKWESWCYDLSK